MINSSRIEELNEVQLTEIGTKYKLQGNLSLAMSYYEKASQLNPNYSPAFYNIGVVYSEIGQFDDALNSYLLAVQKNPCYIEALCNIGVIFKNRGEIEKAIEYYEKSLSVNPNFQIARNNMAISLNDLGTNFKDKGMLSNSILSYQKCLTFNPYYNDAYYNLGVVYSEQGKITSAIICYELVIHFNPSCCEAYNNLGVLYKDSGNLQRSIQCYLSALELKPAFHQTLNNIGVVYTMQGYNTAAYSYIIAALEINPKYPEAFNNLGILYRDEGRIGEAVNSFKSCIQFSSDMHNASQNMLIALNYRKNPLDMIFESHKLWGDKIEKLFKEFEKIPKNILKTRNTKLHIGYIIPNLTINSISNFIKPILDYHSFSNYEIYCYCNIFTKEMLNCSNKNIIWRNIYRKSPINAGIQIREDNIDILIELAGHFSSHSIQILATSPAPIQISFLGYPNTTGLSRIHYRLCDSITDPISTKQKFTEMLIRLPNCFVCYSPPKITPPVSILPRIQNPFITFGCCITLAKVSPRVIQTWIRILQNIPKCKIRIKCKEFTTEKSQEIFTSQFTMVGIEPDRIIILPTYFSNDSRFLHYQKVDISLDTWPYNDFLATCESLYMGVPVITMEGNSSGNNTSKSILCQIGFSHWVAKNEDEYIDIAKANSKRKILKELRLNMRDKLLKSTLFNYESFISNLEATYLSLWHTYLNTK